MRGVNSKKRSFVPRECGDKGKSMCVEAANCWCSAECQGSWCSQCATSWRWCWCAFIAVVLAAVGVAQCRLILLCRGVLHSLVNCDVIRTNITSQTLMFLTKRANSFLGHLNITWIVLIIFVFNCVVILMLIKIKLGSAE